MGWTVGCRRAKLVRSNVYGTHRYSGRRRNAMGDKGKKDKDKGQKQKKKKQDQEAKKKREKQPKRAP
jgi:hypothetical protein